MDEEKFPSMEEERPDALEVAKETHEEREAQKAEEVTLVDNLKTIGNILYWDLYYTTGYSTVVGLGNASGAESRDDFYRDFGEGFMNNASLGVFLNIVYPVVVSAIEKTRHVRLGANLLTTAINGGFLAWHFQMGTENPVLGVLPAYAVGMVMTNIHVNNVRESKESIEDLV